MTFSQSLKDLLDMMGMVGRVLGVYNEFVDVDNEETKV